MSEESGRVERLSLAAAAYETVKRAIIRCELAPGRQVTETQLAGNFNLGRAAVRNALNRLAQEGLVLPVARRGHYVAPITVQRVRDVFEIRLLLEPPAVARAAEIVPDLVRISKFEEACRAVRYQPGDRAAVDRFLRANTAFHVGIVSASGNARLAELVEGLLEEMERFFHFALQLKDRNNEMYHEHHELLRALLAGDAGAARTLAEEQIRTSQHMVLDALLNSPSVTTAHISAAQETG